MSPRRALELQPRKRKKAIEVGRIPCSCVAMSGSLDFSRKFSRKTLEGQEEG